MECSSHNAAILALFSARLQEDTSTAHIDISFLVISALTNLAIMVLDLCLGICIFNITTLSWITLSITTFGFALLKEVMCFFL